MATIAVTSPRGPHASRPRGAVTLRASARTAVTTTASTSSVSEEKRANYERIVGKNAPPDTLLTFAYGANLSAERLRSRGVSPTASLIARAPGYALRFQHRGGYATLDPIRVDDEGDEEEEEGGAYGVVHRISRSELAMIKRWEIGYEMKELGVMIRANDSMCTLTEGDEEEEEEEEEETLVMTTVFVTKPSARLRRPVPPFREYRDRVLDGARVVGLPFSYVDRLTALGEGAVPKAQRGEEYFDLLQKGGGGSGGRLVARAIRGKGEEGGRGGGTKVVVGVAAAAAAFALACFTFVSAR